VHTVRSETTLTWRDLHHCSRDIQNDLLRGHAFVILHAGRPLARLIPVITPPPPLPKGGTAPGHLARLALYLSQVDLARVLGLSGPTLQLYQANEGFPEVITDRLQALAALLDEVTPGQKLKQVQRWFVRSRPELGGGNALATLAFPWTRDDPTIRLIHELARRDHSNRRLASLKAPAPGKPT